MSRTGWKAFERKVAAYFCDKRTPLSGGNSGHTRSDTLHPRLFVECKSNMPAKILRDWKDIKRKAKGRPPVILFPQNWLVVFHCDTPPDLGADPTLRDLLQSTYTQVDYTQQGAIWRLYVDTCHLAALEGKKPLLALGQMNRPGFWIVCELKNVTDILNKR